jgi:hypothetical protein
LKRVFKSATVYTLFLAAGIGSLLLGMVCPFFFRGIAPSLVQRAGQGTPQVHQLAAELTDFGRIGPVFELGYALETVSFQDRLYQLARENSSYFFSGGSAPYIEEIIRRLDLDARKFPKPTSVVELVTPRHHRTYVADFLSRSRNLHVQDILQTRNLKGTIILSPVDAPSGTPTDIAILTLALLIQADEMPRQLAAEVANLSRGAMQGSTTAIEHTEQVWLSVLSLARRFQWVSLSELIRTHDSVQSLNRTAALFRQYQGHRSLLISVYLLHRDPGAIFEYIERYGDEAMTDLAEALPHGKGAIDLLFQRKLPIYRPNAWNPSFDAIEDRLLSTAFYRVAIEQPVLTGIIKLLLLFTAGLCFIILLRLLINRTQSGYRSWVASFLANLGNISIAVAFAICLWLSLEPEFLKQQDEPRPPPIQIQFIAANPFENLKSDLMNSMHIDQVTLLILGLFFILQLAIYAYSRIRLQEIKKLDVQPETKLKLIENEDNLFDSGLYVGLGGTVASLIMLAVNIVEASLMAAYASTLFGIIFVAVLKIFNVRPYRNQLILESRVEPPSPPRQTVLKLK